MLAFHLLDKINIFHCICTALNTIHLVQIIENSGPLLICATKKAHNYKMITNIFCPKYFQEFFKLFSYIIGLWTIKILYTALECFSTKATVLLESINLRSYAHNVLYCSLYLPGIKFRSLKYSPNTLALCWHNTLTRHNVLTMTYLAWA